MALTLDQATQFANLQNRLRAAANQDPDPFTSNVQTAAATAGMIRDAANLAQQNNALTGDAVRLNQIAGGVFAENLAGNAWFSLAKHAAGIISAILIKNGFRNLDAGWSDLRVAGPSIWEIQRKYYGASHQPTMEPVTKLPRPPLPAPPPPAEPSVSDIAKTQTTTPTLTENTAQPRLKTMAIDPITGVDDPLSDEGFTFSTRNFGGDGISASGFDWRDAVAGAAGAYAGGGSPTDIALGGLTGGGLLPPTGTGPMGSGPGAGLPLVQPTNGGGNDPYAALQALVSRLRGLGGAGAGGNGGNGGDGGGMVPGVFDIGDIFQNLGPMFSGGNGQVGSSIMLPGIVQPQAQTRLKAPKGYVIVEVQPDHPLYPVAVNAGGVAQPDGAVKIAMRKQQAKDMKLWKKRPKPALTSGDMKTLRRAETLKKKVARAYLKAGVSPRTLKEVKNC